MIKKKRIIILIIMIIIIVIFFPYIKAEYLTFRYGSQFKDGYLQCRMIDSIEYLRVLDYNKKKSTAKVLYISEDHGCAGDFMRPYYP